MSIICLNLSPTYELAYSVADSGDEVTTAEVFGIVPGGKGLNVAAMLASEGADVVLVTPALHGTLAGAFISEISEALPAVLIHFVDGVSVSPRFSTVIVDRSDSFRTRVYRTTFDPDPLLVDHNTNALIATIERFMDRCQAIVMAGSPGAFGVCTYSAVIDFASNHACRTYVDVGGPPFEKVLEGSWPSVIKVNRSEADQRSLFRNGAIGQHSTLVVVTDGPNTIECEDYTTGEQVQVIPPLAIAPVSPTGAGDAFMAGLVWAREISMREASLESQILEASRWGARAVTSLNSGIGIGRL